MVALALRVRRLEVGRVVRGSVWAGSRSAASWARVRPACVRCRVGVLCSVGPAGSSLRLGAECLRYAGGGSWYPWRVVVSVAGRCWTSGGVGPLSVGGPPHVSTHAGRPVIVVWRMASSRFVRSSRQAAQVLVGDVAAGVYRSQCGSPRLSAGRFFGRAAWSG